MSQVAVERANAQAPPDLYRCVQCGSRFLTASGLQFHIDQTHAKRPAPKRELVVVRGERPIPMSAIGRTSGISAALLAKCQLQGNACHWCGEPFHFAGGAEHILAPTREHAIPKSLGGTTILGIVHRQCNAIRGTIDADAFRRLMAGEAVTRYAMWPHLFADKKG